MRSNSTQQIAPPPTNNQTNETQTSIEKQTENARFPGWILLPLRLFLGVTFFYAGVQKLTDPQFFHRSTPGYIGNQIIHFAHGAPLHDVLIRFVVPHAVIFGWLIALGEIAIGLGVLFGLLTRVAALFGLLLSLVFFLSASWHVYPYFYGSDIVFVFCWLTLLLSGPLNTGLPTVDAWILRNLFPTLLSGRTQPIPLRVLAVLLGASWFPSSPAADLVEGKGNQGSAYGRGTNQRRQSGAQRTKEHRRMFLSGALMGSAGTLVFAALAYAFHTLSPGAETETPSGGVSQPPTPIGAAPSGGSTSNSPAGGTVIAKTSAVPKNSATTFTIASTGDPGVVIHLPNDQFVAFDATCTHAGCQVDYDPGSQHLLCPCHGAEYDPANKAAVLGGPTNTPLTAVAIHVDSATGNIMLQ